MIKNFIPVLFAFVSLKGFAQEKIFFPTSSTKINWSEIEIKATKEDIDSFIKSQPKSFLQFKNSAEYPSLNMTILRKSIHFIDLNFDGKVDVIFNGQSSGEGNEVIVFQNKASGYKKVFQENQNIRKIILKKNQPVKLFIVNEGCCAEYVVRNKIFDLIINKSKDFFLKKIIRAFLCLKEKNQIHYLLNQ